MAWKYWFKVKPLVHFYFAFLSAHGSGSVSCPAFPHDFHGNIQMKTHNSASTSLFGHQSLEGITVWIRSFLKLWELNSCSKPIIKNERNSWTGSKGSDIDNRWCIVVGEFLILFVLLLQFASTQIWMIFQSCSLSYLDQSQSFISLWVPCW